MQNPCILPVAPAQAILRHDHGTFRMLHRCGARAIECTARRSGQFVKLILVPFVLLICLAGCSPSKIELEATLTNDGTLIMTGALIYHKADMSGELKQKFPNAKTQGPWVSIDFPAEKTELDLKALEGRLPIFKTLLGQEDPEAELLKRYEDKCVDKDGKSSISFPQFKSILREIEVKMTVNLPKKIRSRPPEFKKLTDYKLEWSGNVMSWQFYKDKKAVIEFEK